MLKGKKGEELVSYLTVSLAHYSDRLTARLLRDSLIFISSEPLAFRTLFRPGSVEVTATLTVRKKDDIPQLEQGLGNLNRSGMLGNDSWIAIYWGSEGNMLTQMYID